MEMSRKTKKNYCFKETKWERQSNPRTVIALVRYQINKSCRELRHGSLKNGRERKHARRCSVEISASGARDAIDFENVCSGLVIIYPKEVREKETALESERCKLNLYTIEISSSAKKAPECAINIGIRGVTPGATVRAQNPGSLQFFRSGNNQAFPFARKNCEYSFRIIPVCSYPAFVAAISP